jgi:hypothetical protein
VLDRERVGEGVSGREGEWEMGRSGDGETKRIENICNGNTNQLHAARITALRSP